MEQDTNNQQNKKLPSHKEELKFTSRFTSKTGAEKFGLGIRFHHACLSNLQMEPSIQECMMKWMKKPSGMLVFLGSAGVGKTFVCCALLNYFYESGYEVCYITGRRFFQKIQNAIGEKHNQYSEIEKLCDQDILIFDDLGASTNSDWQQEMILDLVDRRYESRKPTVFTSNLSTDSIKKDFGFRTYDRLITSKSNVIIQKWDSSLRSVLD